MLYTGDLCRLDDEGYLYFVGRMDDIIKSRGEKVAPKEVESAIVAIAGVSEAAVIGVPDELLGQAVKAFVVLDAGRAARSRKQIQKECQARLESFMVPKPRSIARRAAEDDDRQDQEDRPAMSDDASPGAQSAPRRGVRSWRRTSTWPTSVLDDKTSFLDRGIIDSTGVLELVTFVENEWRLQVADDEMVPQNFDSIDALVAFVAKKRG